MSHPTLLAVLAHPDDEVFIGGTLAKYAAQGIHVVLATVTRGELGEISDSALATPDTLGEVREGELRAAVQALGIQELRFLDFRDSGMAGTEGNQDPRTLPQTDPTEATRRFVALIRAVRPHVVITHDPTGNYGHPDHIGAWRATVTAFDAAGDASQFPEAGPAWQPPRLFYQVIPRTFFARMRATMEALGMATEAETDEDGGWDEQTYGYDEDQITALVDVTEYLDAKAAAFEAHRTQFGLDHPFRKFPPQAMRDLMGEEPFVQARPVPDSGAPRVNDLFAGIKP